MARATLKPCPLCGAVPKRFVSKTGYGVAWRALVVCGNCRLELWRAASSEANAKRRVARTWNRRASITQNRRTEND
jgi:hypothetical protein